MYIYGVGFIRVILYPFSLLYGLVIVIRNILFDMGILPSKAYDVQVISIGNLTVGGTGKTPHVEYLVRLLQDRYRVATLSRGYGRKTRGFLLVDAEHTIWEVGDEAMQYRRKFPDIIVAVDEDRRHGIAQLLSMPNPPGVILMDDAFQHRYVKAGLSILLTDYYEMYTQDYLLPAGRLREPRRSARRADLIVVTKTDRILSPLIQRELEEDICPRAWQRICYSYIKYDSPVTLAGRKVELNKKTAGNVLLVTGIANPYTLEIYLKGIFREVSHLRFGDHHIYSSQDILLIRETFHDMIGKDKFIITTEKDAMRLTDPHITNQLKDLPVYYIPIRIEFHKNSKQLFNTSILRYVDRSQ